MKQPPSVLEGRSIVIYYKTPPKRSKPSAKKESPMKYFFMITPNGDGGLSVEKLTKEQLEKRLNQELKDGLQRNFLSETKDWIELNDNNNEAIIIDGSIIVPKPVKTVVKYSLDSGIRGEDE
jgi:hypothetical protein